MICGDLCDSILVFVFAWHINATELGRGSGGESQGNFPANGANSTIHLEVKEQ